MLPMMPMTDDGAKQDATQAAPWPHEAAQCHANGRSDGVLGPFACSSVVRPRLRVRYRRRRYGDESQAPWCWQEATERGHANAQYSLGRMCAAGKGAKQDAAQSLRWCKTATEQGPVPAQCRLGSVHHKGEGIKQDINSAVVSGGSRAGVYCQYALSRWHVPQRQRYKAGYGTSTAVVAEGSRSQIGGVLKHRPASETPPYRPPSGLCTTQAREVCGTSSPVAPKGSCPGACCQRLLSQ
jgi:TPR repeat protein